MASRSPTKSPTKGKGKKKETVTPEEKLDKAQLRIKILEQELIQKIDQANRANSMRSELKQKVEHVSSDLQQHKDDNLSILNEMARQYKVMQEELIRRNNNLDLQVAHLKEQLELTHIVLEETKREKDKIIDEKNLIIIEQTRKMELMALEFTEMLKETLEKMGERIEEASKTRKDAGSVLSPRFAQQLEQEFNIKI